MGGASKVRRMYVVHVWSQGRATTTTTTTKATKCNSHKFPVETTLNGVFVFHSLLPFHTSLLLKAVALLVSYRLTVYDVADGYLLPPIRSQSPVSGLPHLH
jgi:hypothetical protein